MTREGTDHKAPDLLSHNTNSRAFQTTKTGGYVPPCLDQTLAGDNWDNLHLLYPVPLFDPSDPRVAATDTKVRASFEEGILPYVLTNALSERNGEYTFEETPRLHYWHTRQSGHRPEQPVTS